MTEKKICPFSLSLNNDSGSVRYCIEERCMAWQPEHIEMRYTSHDIRAQRVPVLVPGNCKLIDK